VVTSAFLEDTISDLAPYIGTDQDLPMIFGAPSAKATPVSVISISIGPEPRQFSAGECTLRNQSARFMWLLQNSRRKKAAPSTITTFRSVLRRILTILPADLLLSQVNNATLKELIAKAYEPRIIHKDGCMRRQQLSPASVQQVALLFKLVVASAVNPVTGDRLFPIIWNENFVDCPRVQKDKQKRSTLTREQVETLCKTPGQAGMIWAFLAGTGLRVSEMQAVRVNGNDSQSTWIPSESVVIVRNACFRNEETGRTKTESGRRRMLVCSELNSTLIAFAEREDGDFLFKSKDGPVRLSTLRDRLSKQIPGAAPHALRRYRNTHLIASRVLPGIVKTQMGHSKGQDMSELYNFQDENFVREQIEAAGLGFQIGETTNA
jgi:integrase